MNTRRKVSRRTRDRLVQIHLHMGKDESARQCVKYGLSPRYAAKEASAAGLLRPRKYTGGGDIAFTVDHNDPRWAWAVERGPVIA